MPAEAGDTEVDVSKAGSYLDGKPEGDNSMTCKSLEREKYLSRQLRCIWLRLYCLNPSLCSVELVSAVMRLTKDLLRGERR